METSRFYRLKSHIITAGSTFFSSLEILKSFDKGSDIKYAIKCAIYDAHLQCSGLTWFLAVCFLGHLLIDTLKSNFIPELYITKLWVKGT